MSSQERIPAYEADVTYGTNSEFGFDYLRDNMKVSKGDQVQRGLALRDRGRGGLDPGRRGADPPDHQRPRGGRTGEVRGGRQRRPASRARRRLRGQGEGAPVRAHRRRGRRRRRSWPASSFWEAGESDWPHLLEQALRAHHIYKRDKDYVAKDGEIIIVDEFTGRLMEGRRWSDGLHQAVEAKEGIHPRAENQTLATITYQNFFRLYDKLERHDRHGDDGGGRVLEDLQARRARHPDEPAAHPARVRRHDLPAEKDKYKAVVEEVVTVHKTGRPILVGTTSIEKSEYISGHARAAGRAARRAERQAPRTGSADRRLGGPTRARW